MESEPDISVCQEIENLVEMLTPELRNFSWIRRKATLSNCTAATACGSAINFARTRFRISSGFARQK
jgi:hypothetical protein